MPTFAVLQHSFQFLRMTDFPVMCHEIFFLPVRAQFNVVVTYYISKTGATFILVRLKIDEIRCQKRLLYPNLWCLYTDRHGPGWIEVAWSQEARGWRSLYKPPRWRIMNIVMVLFSLFTTFIIIEDITVSNMSFNNLFHLLIWYIYIPPVINQAEIRNQVEIRKIKNYGSI